MARVIRSCWTYKPLHRYRVFPRPESSPNRFYDYEAAGAGPAQFPDRLPDDERPALWAVWIYKQQATRTHIQDQLRMLFGEHWKAGRMHIFKNIPSVNKELWKIKHLIQVRPLVFPNGPPTDADYLHTRVMPDGTVNVDPALNSSASPGNVVLSREPTDLTEDASWLANRLTDRMVTKNTLARFKRSEQLQEDEQWSDPAVSKLL